jgi:hypothetical protein
LLVFREGDTTSDRVIAAGGQTRGFLLHATARRILLAWTATGAIHYWSLLRKRLVLGSTDPMASNQILLWGFSGSFAFVGTSVVGYAVFVLRQHPLELFGITAVLMAMVSAKLAPAPAGPAPATRVPSMKPSRIRGLLVGPPGLEPGTVRL